MAQTKHAILIGSTEFPQSSSELAPLPSAARDVSDLQSVLTDPELTQFDNVQVALDLPHWEVMRRINEVMRKAAREDQIFVYYSGHGLLDNDAHLYLATVNTEPQLLQVTSLPVDSLRSLFRETQCRRIIVVLDCCFAANAINQLNVDGYLEDSFRDTSESMGQGYAISVIAAAAGNAQAFAPKNGSRSYMTGIMIDAIRSGEADQNLDGSVTVQELYEFTRDRMRAEGRTEPLFFHRGPMCSLTMANLPKRAVWNDLVARINERVQTTKAELRDKANSPHQKIIERAKSILNLPEKDILQNHEALFSLLKEWALNKLSLEELSNQWYQFDKTDLVATDISNDEPGLPKS